MKKLLLLEWMKVRKYRTFWVFLILFVVAIIGVNAVLFSAQSHVKHAFNGMVNIQMFDFPVIWSTTAWASGFSVLLLGLLLIVLITNEYAFKTRRQHVIDGLGRKQFIAGKWLVAVAFLIFAWLVYVAVTLVIGAVNHSGGNNFLQGFHFTGYFLLKVALSLSVAFMFAIWLKRSGLAIALYLLYVLLLEGIISHLLNWIVDGMGYFLPLRASGELVSNPVSQLMPGMDKSSIPVGWLVFTCIIYLIVFGYISVWSMQRADL